MALGKIVDLLDTNFRTTKKSVHMDTCVNIGTTQLRDVRDDTRNVRPNSPMWSLDHFQEMQQQQHHQQQPIQIQMSLSQMTKMTDMELMMDDSLDSASVASLESQLPAGTVLMTAHCPTVITSMAQQQQQVQQQHQMQPIQVTVQVAAPQSQQQTVTVASSPVPPQQTQPPQVSTPSSSGSGPPPPVPHTPTPSSSKKKSNKNKVVTGYILYSREVRKQVVQNNPESTFGDISRIVGSEWKSLPQSEKQLWEERASRLNEETKATMMNVAAAAAAAAGEDSTCASPQPNMPPQDQIYECLWDTCDYQFEDTIDLIEHCIKDRDQPSHVTAFFQENPGLEFHCHWRNCARNRKNPQPFPNATRLIRHIRDMHINKGNGRSVPPDKRSSWNGKRRRCNAWGRSCWSGTNGECTESCGCGGRSGCCCRG
ncbi:unnamed protein product [Acanthoscelides obtectus]|uniref:HMG box domain-containing protein n=1 Tax=Acanthoscelides obtectus TaxID=200917 RepID=A0A9P0MGV1_ACAOB|nr:unnamed protein product [Acanthoscelides obtectus]CAK1674317.1 Protein polybromo-1 [Acanthoscelides obtectus]